MTNVVLIAVFLIAALTVTSVNAGDINGGVDHGYSHGYKQGNQHGYYDVKYPFGGCGPGWHRNPWGRCVPNVILYPQYRNDFRI
jgi:hypothetical protein